ncbi:MAG: starch synthase, partial [Microcystis aeruginosa]
GFVFFDPDNNALESAMSRALELWYTQPEEFQKLAIQGMECDYSWNRPGEEYVALYEMIRHK